MQKLLKNPVKIFPKYEIFESLFVYKVKEVGSGWKLSWALTASWIRRYAVW
jgi:hypothetical protein